jgi:hypothetical protein
MAVGLRHGRRKGEGREAKERSYERTARVVEDFRERFGTILCRELIKIDLSGPEGRETYRRENIRDEHCVNYVTTAVRAAYEAIAS